MHTLREALGRSTDPRPLAATRIGVGIAAGMIGVETARALLHIAVQGKIRVPVADWMPALDEPAIWAILAAWSVLAVALTVGFWGRAAAAGLAALVAFAMLLDQQVYSNHLALLGVLVALLALGKPTAAWSVDASVRGRGARSILYWPTLLVRVQISALYAFAALSKLNGVFLSGDVLRAYVRFGGLPHSLFAIAAIATPGVELFLAGALWSRRLWPVAVVVGITFHLVLILVLLDPSPLIAFAVLAISGYPAFLDRPARQRSPTKLRSARARARSGAARDVSSGV